MVSVRMSMVYFVIAAIIGAVIINFLASINRSSAVNDPGKVSRPSSIASTSTIVKDGTSEVDFKLPPKVLPSTILNSPPAPILLPTETKRSKESVVASKKSVQQIEPTNSFAEISLHSKTHGDWFNGLRVCEVSVDERLSQPVLQADDLKWCRDALDPKKGKVVVGQSWGNLKSRPQRDKFEALNCNSVNSGKNPSCNDAWGDAHVHNWRKNVAVDISCQPRSKGRVRCYKNDINDQYCVFHDAMIDFSKMHHQRRPGGVDSRTFERSFLTVDCDGRANIADFKLEHLFSSKRSADAVCDVTIPGKTLLYSHDNVRNMCHTWNDVANIWLLLWLENLADRIGEVNLLTVDAMKLYNNFDDTVNDFFTTYRHFFRSIMRGLDYKDEKVCFEELITQSLPSRGFVWENWQQDLPCSFTGPSSLFQRWNVQVRSAYKTLHNTQVKTGERLQVLLIVRSETKNDWGSYRTSRLMKNTEEVVSALRSMSQGSATSPPFDLVVQDMSRIAGFSAQVALVANTSVIIGMHGAGIVHTMHMSLGTQYCCGVLEIFPRGEFTPVRGYANMIRKLGLHYRRIDIDGQHSGGDGAVVDSKLVTEQLDSLLQAIVEDAETDPAKKMRRGIEATGTGCILQSVVKNPYLH